ncbi:dUTP diphosphatase [Arenimonas sp.]|nr:dUTP diphosphatase [Candidatus Parcubacteria bacterium]
MQLKFKKIHPTAKIPSYAYAGDAGLDLYISEDLVLKKDERKSIPLGIAIEIPDGYVGILFDKSGLSHKHGLKSYGGIIDSGYRGEIHVGMMNLSDTDYGFKAGDKIIQILIMPIPRCEIIECNELSKSDRGEGAFGSSGNK